MPENVPKWTLYPCGGTSFRIELLHAPNFAHRFLQKVVFGFKYVKIKKERLY